jgi:hypothetical protein
VHRDRSSYFDSGPVTGVMRMPTREPLKTKQKALIVIVTFCLQMPMILFILYFRDSVSPREFAGIGLVNLIVGVSLLALISEKWIRKMK